MTDDGPVTKNWYEVDGVPSGGCGARLAMR
jgi:hypothetical protein